jgi:hypothetical protein
VLAGSQATETFTFEADIGFGDLALFMLYPSNERV